MKYLLTLALIFLPPSVQSAITIVWGDGGSRETLAYGSFPESGQPIGAANGTCFTNILLPPNNYFRITTPAATACANSGRDPTRYIRDLLSGPGMPVFQIPQTSVGGPGIAVSNGTTIIWYATGVSIGDKPIGCSVNKNLIFDYNSIPLGEISSTILRENLPVVCSGRATGTLTLRGSNNGTISLGSSGLTAKLSANNAALGSKITFGNGTTNVDISSELRGTTTSPGIKSGSGVLVLNVQ